MAVNINRWAVRYLKIKEPCPKPSEPFLSELPPISTGQSA